MKENFAMLSGSMYEAARDAVGELRTKIDERPNRFVNTQNKECDTITVLVSVDDQPVEMHLKGIVSRHGYLYLVADHRWISYRDEDILSQQDEWSVLSSDVDLYFMENVCSILESIDQYL